MVSVEKPLDDTGKVYPIFETRCLSPTLKVKILNHDHTGPPIRVPETVRLNPNL